MIDDDNPIVALCDGCGASTNRCDCCVRDDSTECGCSQCAADEERFWDEQGADETYELGGEAGE